MSDKQCKCSMAISVLGDGCRYCQPQEYIDNMTQWLIEEREELAKAEQESAELKRKMQTPYNCELQQRIIDLERIIAESQKQEAEAWHIVGSTEVTKCLDVNTKIYSPLFASPVIQEGMTQEADAVICASCGAIYWEEVSSCDCLVNCEQVWKIAKVFHEPMLNASKEGV